MERAFNEYIKSSIDDLLKKCKTVMQSNNSRFINELEFRFGKKEKKFFNSNNNVMDFQKMINYMRSEYPVIENINSETKLTNFDIMINNTENTVLNDMRISVNGTDNVMAFCKTNSLDDLNDVTFQTKKRISNTEIKEFSNIRISASFENNILVPENNNVNGVSISDINKFLKSNRYQKVYRIKRRYSFVVSIDSESNNFVRVDFTIVQQSYGYTFEMSNIKNTGLRYEIEIEFLGNIDINKTDSLTTNENLFEFIRKFLTAYNNDYHEKYLLTDTVKNSIISNYLNIFYKNAYSNEDIKKNARRYFIGTDVLPVEHSDVVKQSNDNIRLVNEKYFVSLKADGQRMILFIRGDDSNVYLIDSKLHVRVIGTLESNIPKGEYYVVDGEIVKKSWMEQNVFLCIDMMYSKDIDIRNKLFFEPGKDSISRLTLLQDFIKTIKINEIEIRLMHYKQLAKKEDFSNFLETVKKHEDFEIDGYIFTPNTMYPQDIKKRNNVRLKWKPKEKQSIDFKLKFFKNKNNTYQIQEYKKEQRLKASLHYITSEKGKEAYPIFRTSSYQDASYIYLKLNENNKPVFEDNIIEDDTIAECVFINNEWSVIKLRQDKVYPNGKRTVFSNWNLIVEPIELDNIKYGTNAVRNFKKQETIKPTPKIEPKEEPKSEIIVPKAPPRKPKISIKKPLPEPETVPEPLPETGTSVTSSVPIAPPQKPKISIKKPLTESEPVSVPLPTEVVSSSKTESSLNEELPSMEILQEQIYSALKPSEKNKKENLDKVSFTVTKNRLMSKKLYSENFIKKHRKSIEIALLNLKNSKFN
jgi:hypothetical protein